MISKHSRDIRRVTFGLTITLDELDAEIAVVRAAIEGLLNKTTPNRQISPSAAPSATSLFYAVSEDDLVALHAALAHL